jgi:hypothetical protein
MAVYLPGVGTLEPVDRWEPKTEMNRKVVASSAQSPVAVETDFQTIPLRLPHGVPITLSSSVPGEKCDFRWGQSPAIESARRPTWTPSKTQPAPARETRCVLNNGTCRDIQCQKTDVANQFIAHNGASLQNPSMRFGNMWRSGNMFVLEKQQLGGGS